MRMIANRVLPMIVAVWTSSLLFSAAIV